MKKVLWAAWLGLVLVGCQVTEPISPAAGSQPLDATASSSEVESALMPENGLKIVEFREDGEDKTSLFADYLFSFEADGTVTASKGSETVRGTYRVFRDDGRTELAMAFATAPRFFELTDDWYFVSQEDGMIRFADSPDTLIFEVQ